MQIIINSTYLQIYRTGWKVISFLFFSWIINKFDHVHIVIKQEISYSASTWKKKTTVLHVALRASQFVDFKIPNSYNVVQLCTKYY